VVEAVRRTRTLVLQAAPGAGKTTRVPRALLDAGAFEGELWVLEPRRLAARMAAARVAEELGESLGRTVGYTIRFDEVSSTSTRIRFVTEGILTRRLLSDPLLRGVGAVVLDEFHERHSATDLGSGLRALRQRRPELARSCRRRRLGPGRGLAEALCSAGGGLSRSRWSTSRGRPAPAELRCWPD
jgi:ATP-dependent helicase HrpB